MVAPLEFVDEPQFLVGGKHVLSILPHLRQFHPNLGTFNLPQDKVDFLSSIPSIEEEERMLRGGVRDELETYMPSRTSVLGGYRALVAWLFREHCLPTDGVLDIGPGPQGAFLEHLAKGVIDSRRSVQLDINRHVVEHHRKRFPNSCIEQGSFLRLAERERSTRFDLVTSLSALDETLYPERALDQVYRSLRKGGFFVVLSDVNPGSMQLMQAIKKLGIEGPYSLTGTFSSIGMPNFHYLETEGGLISVLEIYRSMLLQLALEHRGLEVVLSDWVTCKKMVAEGELCKIYQANNVFGVIRIPKPRVPFEEVSVAVTVLRKKY